MDVETVKEFIERYEVIKAYRALWLALAFDPAMRDAAFPTGTQPGDAWRAGGFETEDDALASGYVAVWPE